MELNKSKDLNESKAKESKEEAPKKSFKEKVSEAKTSFAINHPVITGLGVAAVTTAVETGVVVGTIALISKISNKISGSHDPEQAGELEYTPEESSSDLMDDIEEL